MKKFENLKVGDVLKNDNDYEIVVLDVFTQSCVYEDKYGSSWLTSFKGLEQDDYEIVKPEWRADVEGQEYWYIHTNTDFYKVYWSNNIRDKYRLKTNNCFETEELAEAKYKEIMES